MTSRHDSKWFMIFFVSRHVTTTMFCLWDDWGRVYRMNRISKRLKKYHHLFQVAFLNVTTVSCFPLSLRLPSCLGDSQDAVAEKTESVILVIKDQPVAAKPLPPPNSVVIRGKKVLFKILSVQPHAFLNMATQKQCCWFSFYILQNLSLPWRL